MTSKELLPRGALFSLPAVPAPERPPFSSFGTVLRRRSRSRDPLRILSLHRSAPRRRLCDPPAPRLHRARDARHRRPPPRPRREARRRDRPAAPGRAGIDPRDAGVPARAVGGDGLRGAGAGVRLRRLRGAEPLRHAPLRQSPTCPASSSGRTTTPCPPRPGPTTTPRRWRCCWSCRGRLAGTTTRVPVTSSRFANEEPPFFTGPGMGSAVFAKDLETRGVAARADDLPGDGRVLRRRAGEPAVSGCSARCAAARAAGLAATSSCCMPDPAAREPAERLRKASVCRAMTYACSARRCRAGFGRSSGSPTTAPSGIAASPR